MPTPRTPRLVAPAAIVAGITLLGVAVGGLASVDGELRAAATPTTPRTELVRLDRTTDHAGRCEHRGAPTYRPTDVRAL
jgi:hypothetical protein